MRVNRSKKILKIRNELRSETKKEINDKSSYIPSVEVANKIRVLKEYLRNKVHGEDL
jgi:hypothetical protein